MQSIRCLMLTLVTIQINIVLVDAEIEYQKFATGKAFIQAVPPPVLKVVKKPKSKYESKKQQEYDTTKRFENGLKIQKFILEKLRPHQI